MIIAIPNYSEAKLLYKEVLVAVIVAYCLAGEHWALPESCSNDSLAR